MAEKEERILIQVMDNWCQYRYPIKVNLCDETGEVVGHNEDLACHREDNWGEPCDDKCCEQCKRKEMLGISRQEAIEKIAKGLCAENLSHSCKDCMRNGTNDCFINEKEDFYKSLAEAALNALLDTDAPKDNKNQN